MKVGMKCKLEQVQDFTAVMLFSTAVIHFAACPDSSAYASPQKPSHRQLTGDPTERETELNDGRSVLVSIHIAH